MADYKLEAAKAAMQFLIPGQTIGVGAGSSVAHLIWMIAASAELTKSLTLVTSSYTTSNLIQSEGLNLQSVANIQTLDIYFDGCDQFDEDLTALKSGGGIHTSEKILATLATQFILIGDESKYADSLSNHYPLVLEVLPPALNLVRSQLLSIFPDLRFEQRMSNQKDGAVISEYGNYLVDVYLPDLFDANEINREVSMIPGVVEHSLFYRIAQTAVIAGENGIQILTPRYK